METSSLKRFATEARKSLLEGVVNRLEAIGFMRDGRVMDRPQLMSGGAMFMGGIVSEDFYHRWMSLERRILQVGFRAVAEEGAYIWFNRLMAIRIMAKNNLISPTLALDEDLRIPLLVAEARQGRMPEMDALTRQKLEQLLMDDSKTDEQFQLLIVAFCHATPVINRCFGGLQDYTELLLPADILREHGFLPLLNDTNYISDEDFRSPELIGWLYQFYNSDRKDEVFAKKGKYDADEIAPATQIFTPNWIVKYMVQNTVGRIYIDNNPWEADDLKDKWKYLVEPAEEAKEENILHFDDLKELNFADLACGSGHILNEIFDLVYDLYVENGYSPADAIRNIFIHNLTGVELDTRAKQLATFALMLKACQKDSQFLDCETMPRVLDMPKLLTSDVCMDEAAAYNAKVGLLFGDASLDELCESFELMQDADTLGSIMKFSFSEATREYVAQAVEAYDADKHADFSELVAAYKLMLALTEEYSALVMNPPYMGGGNMNSVLSDYIKKNYAAGKADLCTVFFLLQGERTAKNGYYANIIPPSWMFLSSFEALRKQIIDNNVISSLLHLSRGVFGADFGSVSCAVQNRKDNQANGTYFRLIERTFQEFDQKHLQLLFEKTLENNDFRYFFGDYTKEATDIVYSEKGAKIYYPNVSQKNFEKIPGCPIGYWVSDKIVDAFEKEKSLANIANPRKGLVTLDDARFIHYWFGIAKCDFQKPGVEKDTVLSNNRKWVVCNKGGGSRKHYGLNHYVVFWKDNGKILKDYIVEKYKGGSYTKEIRSESLYFLDGITWSGVTSGNPTFRSFEKGGVFPSSGPSAFPKKNKLYILALLNSKVSATVFQLLSPTLSVLPGDIAKMPIKYNNIEFIESLYNKCINISKLDWDAHETSWDFELNELLAAKRYCGENVADMDMLDEDELREIKAIKYIPTNGKLLSDCMQAYKNKWEHNFKQLHKNEEELNRQFIDIYGLQDELTPDVPMDEITILQQDEIEILPAPGDTSGNLGSILWHNDVIIKQLLSYAIGCMMGRYSIDKTGLILANQGDGLKEFNELVPDSRFTPDDDGIVPMMDSSRSQFTDNAALRLKQWLTAAFGEETLQANLNTIEKALGKTIDDYFVKDFWKDHKRMYQNRPIYWLFASKKGAFQCAVYMHRMDAYTAERIRQKYLLPHIEWLTQRQSEMEANAANLSARDRKELDNIGKQIDECREYHERLHVVADKQIAFDLDDGVVVNHAKFGDVLAKLK